MDLADRSAVTTLGNRLGDAHPDVFLAAWLTGPSGQDLARLSLTLVDALNGIYDASATAAGVDFADVSDAFRTSDFTMVDDPTFGEIPANVAMICSMTWMCTQQDIHANDEGYALIASVVAAMLREPSGGEEPSSPSSSSSSSSSSTTEDPTSTVPSSPAGGPQTPALVQTDGGLPVAEALPAVLALIALAGLLGGAAAARRRAAARH